jgi:2-C-methyl-D-erythritol 4-phosphate cytidylyltransferase
MNVAIILAGGTGSRIGAGRPKQFIEILGKPILAYTLEIFQKNTNIDAIEIVCHKDWVDEIKEIVNRYGITKTKWYAPGGETYQESFMNGVFNLKDKISDNDLVISSFGVSPMTTDEEIDDSIRVAEIHGNAIASQDIPLCTCIKDDEESSTQSILRENLKGFANPWTFRYGELCEAYEEGFRRDILKDLEPHTTSLYFALGKTIYFSKASNYNCKITYKEDLEYFEGLMLLRSLKQENNSSKQA